MNIKHLPLFSHDKANHFVYGVLVYVVTFHISMLLGLDSAAAIALSASIIIGLAKECFDAAHGGKFDTVDWLVTFLGGLACYTLTIG
jgi:hypothetical protein